MQRRCAVGVHTSNIENPNSLSIGGANRLTFFKYYTGTAGQTTSTQAPPATSAPGNAATSAQAAASSSAASSSAAPVATGLPTGFQYKGCYVDGPGFRIMNYQQADDQAMTIASCSKKCADAGYTIAGMEYSYQCFCDNVIRMNGSLASSDSECNTNCAGNANQKCGGVGRSFTIA